MSRGCSTGWRLGLSRSAVSTAWRKCVPQEIALLYRYVVHRVTVHAGKAMSRFLLTLLRTSESQHAAVRVLRNVNDIVGYDAPRTPYADPPCCVGLGPRLSASPLNLQLPCLI